MLRSWPKVLSAGFAVLVASQVLVANRVVGEDKVAIVLATGLVLLAVGAALTRRLAGWLAMAGFVVAIASLAVLVLASDSERAADIASSLLNLGCAGGVAALCALRGGQWGAAAALAAIGELVVLPPSSITDIPFEHLSELCMRYHGALGVMVQLAVGYAACAAAAKRD